MYIYNLCVALFEVNGNLEGVGDGWFRFYENLEVEKYASDGTLLYVVSREGAAMTTQWADTGRKIQPELSENYPHQIFVR